MINLKKVILTLCLLGCMQPFLQAQTPQGVVGYFEKLSESMRAGFVLKKQADGTYISEDPLTEEPASVIVDTKNGYIQIQSEGTGGGTITLTVVLYRKENREAVIGVSTLRDDGFQSFEVQFLKYTNNKYQTITSEVLPTLTHKNFLKTNMDLSNYDELLQASPICITLPRYGTTAKSNIGDGYIKFKCEQEQDTKACTLQNNVYQSIDLIWDKKLGKFSIGKKE